MHGGPGSALEEAPGAKVFLAIRELPDPGRPSPTLPETQSDSLHVVPIGYYVRKDLLACLLANLGTHVASLLLLSAHAVTVTGLPTLGISLEQSWGPWAQGSHQTLLERTSRVSSSGAHCSLLPLHVRHGPPDEHSAHISS